MTAGELKEIGERIRKRRCELLYTQEYLAELMDVSVQMVSNLERGNKAIRIDNLIKVSKILRMSTDYILKGELPGKDQNTLVDKLYQLPENEYRMIEMLINYCMDK